MKLVVGLGNPGSRYDETRHNIGFKVIDELVDQCKAKSLSKSSFEGLVYKSSDIILLKPLTYMNLSGKSVAAVARFFKIALNDVIVIHDDIDLPFGAVRFKLGGGHGGHNGLKSIDAMLGKDYIRVRIGVGRPQDKTEVSRYVLSAFLPDERRCIVPLTQYVAQATCALLESSLDEVRQTYTKKNIDTIC